jgi:phage gp16-like protein
MAEAAATAKKKPTMAETARRADLAKIHIAKKALGMDDSEYRAVLLGLTGKESAGKLNRPDRKSVLAYMENLGFVPKPRKKPARKPPEGRPSTMQPPGTRNRTSRENQLAKIEALLTVGSRPWSYADALAKRICKVEKIIWVPGDQLCKVIAALRYQARREGWDLSGEIK